MVTAKLICAYVFKYEKSSCPDPEGGTGGLDPLEFENFT